MIMIMVFFIFIVMIIIMIWSLLLLKVMWSAEIQILNENMIVAVVIAIYWVGCALPSQDHKEVTCSYLRKNSAHTA